MSGKPVEKPAIRKKWLPIASTCIQTITASSESEAYTVIYVSHSRGNFSLARLERRVKREKNRRGRVKSAKRGAQEK